VEPNPQLIVEPTIAFVLKGIEMTLESIDGNLSAVDSGLIANAILTLSDVVDTGLDKIREAIFEVMR